MQFIFSFFSKFYLQMVNKHSRYAINVREIKKFFTCRKLKVIIFFLSFYTNSDRIKHEPEPKPEPEPELKCDEKVNEKTK